MGSAVAEHGGARVYRAAWNYARRHLRQHRKHELHYSVIAIMFAVTAGLSMNLLSLLLALVAMCGAGKLIARLLHIDRVVMPINQAGVAAKQGRPAWGWSFLLGLALVRINLQIPLAIY